MADHDADIILIQKYLNGELDARAMHQLEARAQDDPFLADALEGYEKSGRGQQANLTGLSKRLQQRVEEKKVKRLIPFRTLAIAASVLVVFTIGWLVFTKTSHVAQPHLMVVKRVEKTPPVQPVAKETTAAAQMLAKASTPAIRSRTIVKTAAPEITRHQDAVPVVAEPAADKDVIANAVVPNADTADNTPLNELVVMNYRPAKKNNALNEVTVAKPSQNSLAQIAPPAAVAPEYKLNSKADGLNSAPADLRMTSPGSQKFYLQGRIVDEIDGAPLQGVSIKAYGTNFGTVTDRDGRFNIPSERIKRGFTVSRLGYNTAKIGAAAAGGDSLKTISLAPADIPTEAALSNNTKNPSVAHPQIGWKKYNRYLSGASVSPDRETGTVLLSFWVDKTGAITNVTVLTSLSDDADKKAIDLIKKGPKWVGNTSGKPEQVELAINF